MISFNDKGENSSFIVETPGRYHLMWWPVLTFPVMKYIDIMYWPIRCTERGHSIAFMVFLPKRHNLGRILKHRINPDGGIFYKSLTGQYWRKALSVRLNASFLCIFFSPHLCYNCFSISFIVIKKKKSVHKRQRRRNCLRWKATRHMTTECNTRAWILYQKEYSGGIIGEIWISFVDHSMGLYQC